MKNMSTPVNQAKIGMVFGVFDGFHLGHQHFLTEATKRCEKLIVVVAVPEMVEKLKNRKPHHSYEERAQKIHAFNPKWEIVPSDTEIGTWSALKTFHPDIVFLGHDQVSIGEELEKIGVPFLFITAHHPHKYKSSLLLKTN